METLACQIEKFLIFAVLFENEIPKHFIEVSILQFKKMF